ncbi:hypothetical protein BX589_12063 [Paraburkholderia fungorum]|jgi:hypothetical protein|uniref:hypothetical protein n=1 Tax=Paraburkholderia fungorum TaxID=134537 RepID=UPI000D068C66|nr:hypothetical protein [Paraburkholderia fungorum]PRZ51222.1 hypothetical protein BX589_12063 [Paraburkholderia fungorum]
MADTPTKAPAADKQSGECPRYELTEPAYLKADGDSFDRMHEAKSVIEFRGVPGYHMTPLNDEAKAMVAKHKPQMLEFNKLTPVTA